MKLFHIIAIKHNPPEIVEKYPNEAERERSMVSLMRRYDTVFCAGSFHAKREDAPSVERGHL